jgi:hypothetical protein
MVLLGTPRLSDEEVIEAHPPGAVPPPVEAGGDLNVRDLRRNSI